MTANVALTRTERRGPPRLGPPGCRAPARQGPGPVLPAQHGDSLRWRPPPGGLAPRRRGGARWIVGTVTAPCRTQSRRVTRCGRGRGRAAADSLRQTRIRVTGTSSRRTAGRLAAPAGEPCGRLFVVFFSPQWLSLTRI